MSTHTKIICTIGPATQSKEMILKLIDAGMRVARINFSHGNHEDHLKTINNIKQARNQAKIPIAILLDTKGPEIRIGELKNDILNLNKGDILKLIKGPAKEDFDIPINPFEVLSILKPNQKILFDDGYITAKVIEKNDSYVLVKIQNPGVIKSKKGVNIPNVILPLPAVTPQDIEDLKFGCENDIDIVAASFIRSADHVLEIKKILEKNNKSDIFVVAKIECKEAVDNFDEIVDVSDGIMVARGDLGVEVELSLVPKLQKEMVNKCYEVAKPVIIATQMLESMINNPRPTRAEVSDVANAIYESASCVMLSAETATGKYPIETVIQMRKIIHQAESDFDYKSFFYKEAHVEYEDVSSSVVVSSVKTAYSSNAKAIFAVTRSGFTTRLLTRMRPEIPIIALTKSEKKFHQLSFLWGVKPIYSQNFETEREAFAIMSNFSIERNIIAFGDFVVMVSSFPFDKKGITNLMLVESVGDVLVKGSFGFGKQLKGKIAKISSLNGNTIAKAKDKIVVISRCSEKYESILKEAKAIVLQNSPKDKKSEEIALKLAKNFNISIIVRAKHAFDILEDNLTVCLDPKKAILFRHCEYEK